MNNTQENFYRIIKPYDSNVLHSSSSLTGGASKCYKELKKVNPNSNCFSLIHMQTNKIYDFEINNMRGGNGDSTVSQSEIKRLEGEIDSLKKRIVDLENKVNPPQAIPSHSQVSHHDTMPQQKITNIENKSKEFEHPMMNGGVYTDFNFDLAKKFIS
jgi:hypothetical protein